MYEEMHLYRFLHTGTKIIFMLHCPLCVEKNFIVYEKCDVRLFSGLFFFSCFFFFFPLKVHISAHSEMLKLLLKIIFIHPRRQLISGWLVSWLIGCRIKANCPSVGPDPSGAMLRGALSKGSYLVYTRVLEKNSERLGRQARLGIEPGTSRLPALRKEPLHW